MKMRIESYNFRARTNKGAGVKICPKTSNPFQMVNFNFKNSSQKMVRESRPFYENLVSI